MVLLGNSRRLPLRKMPAFWPTSGNLTPLLINLSLAPLRADLPGCPRRKHLVGGRPHRASGVCRFHAHCRDLRPGWHAVSGMKTEENAQQELARDVSHLVNSVSDHILVLPVQERHAAVCELASKIRERHPGVG